MKSIVILYKDKNSSFCNEKVFENKSAMDLSKEWAESLKKDLFYIEDCKSVSELFSKMSQLCLETHADYVIYSYADLPFLNKDLTEKLMETHETYKAEYTFADGYSYGFAPELIDKGTIGILKNLSESVQKEDGEKSVSRDSVFSFMKKDINSYEIESVLSDKDWRLFRYSFHTGCRENFVSCKGLYNLMENGDSVELLQEKASKSLVILKTLPGFFNIQIQDRIQTSSLYSPYEKAYEAKFKINPLDSKNFMDLQHFSTLIDSIKNFTDKGVIGLSAFGDPFETSDLIEYIKKVLDSEGFSVFLETDGLNITEEFCQKLSGVIEGIDNSFRKWPAVMIAVRIDAFSDETYEKIHGKKVSVKSLAEKVALLNKVIPGSVYTQFVRMNINEDELEGFYRYWNDKNNESSGNLIIQKYNSYCGLLPECKPADLSPLERNVCWHLRRDITILSNGDVPLCSQFIYDRIIGNVFEQSLADIWLKFDEEIKNHICGKYSKECEKCDEYYTYNF